jgi:hypothetical protein
MTFKATNEWTAKRIELEHRFKHPDSAVYKATFSFVEAVLTFCDNDIEHAEIILGHACEMAKKVLKTYKDVHRKDK